MTTRISLYDPWFYMKYFQIIPIHIRFIFLIYPAFIISMLHFSFSSLYEHFYFEGLLDFVKGFSVSLEIFLWFLSLIAFVYYVSVLICIYQITFTGLELNQLNKEISLYKYIVNFGVQIFIGNF